MEDTDNDGMVIDGVERCKIEPVGEVLPTGHAFKFMADTLEEKASCQHTCPPRWNIRS
jgi:hypothetical protein